MIHETIEESILPVKDYIIHAHMGNTVIKSPDCEAYGDIHPRFGFPDSENDVEELAHYLRTLMEIGFLGDVYKRQYHDQGQIALKLKGFDQGITIAVGLPAPIVTCAHGTAYDIAGKGIVKTSAFENAVKMAAKMAAHLKGC